MILTSCLYPCVPYLRGHWVTALTCIYVVRGSFWILGICVGDLLKEKKILLK